MFILDKRYLIHFELCTCTTKLNYDQFGKPLVSFLDKTRGNIS